jgi:hypothetical protein
MSVSTFRRFNNLDLIISPISYPITNFTLNSIIYSADPLFYRIGCGQPYCLNNYGDVLEIHNQCHTRI